MRYALLCSLATLALVAPLCADDGISVYRPVQSTIQAQQPPQAPPLASTDLVTYAKAYHLAERGDSDWKAFVVYVGHHNKPPRFAETPLPCCWAETLAPYKDGDVVRCAVKEGRVWFDRYVKGGPATSGNPGGTPGDPPFGGFATGFSSGGNCSGGSCGAPTTTRGGLFRRR